MTAKSFAVAVAAVMLALPALADDATPDTAGGRYTFSKVGDGFVRLDGQTGDVSVCGQRTVGWACQAAPDDRAVLEDEIGRLRGENAVLKRDILARGLPLPPGVLADSSGAADSGGSEVTIRLPDNADVDRAVAYMGQVWQRLVDAITRAGKQVLNKS